MTNKKRATSHFDFMIPTVIPSFVQGAYAETVYNQVNETLKLDVRYDSDSRTMIGSSTFAAARVDSIVRKLNLGLRVTTLTDLSKPEIIGFVKDRCYSDIPAIVFRTTKDYSPNSRAIKQLIPMIEKKLGRLMLPALVTGFDIAPSKDEYGYRLDIIARADFEVLHDERFKGEYDGKHFSTVDERGLPNFKTGGSRTWHASDKGLSGLWINRNLDLASKAKDIDRRLTRSHTGGGRIILVKDFAQGSEKR